MATEARDERLGVTFASTVDELSLKNKDGKLLEDLYVLHAVASYGEGEAAREETTDLYVYKPKITETEASSATATASTGSTTGSRTTSSVQTQQPTGGGTSGGGATTGRSGR